MSDAEGATEGRSGRVTIREIARRAGVSKGAVSYALNGRPGVSRETRERVLAVARELDWVPNSAARMLSGARTETFGLVLARTPETLGQEPFFMELVAGLESVLARRSYALMLQVAQDLEQEMATYRKWTAERRVDAVVVVDLRVDDPRVPLLESLQLPALVVANRSLAGTLPCVWSDDAAGAGSAVRHLADLGHRRLARVAGPAELGHVGIRDRAFAASVEAAGLQAVTVRTDFSGEAGAAATRELLGRTDPPTALLYDNDLMAVAGLSVLAGLGRRVPDDVTLVAWDDSSLCRVTHPTLTAMSHDVVAFGAAVAEHLFAVLDGEEREDACVSVPELVVRGSSAPPAGSDGRPRRVAEYPSPPEDRHDR